MVTGIKNGCVDDARHLCVDRAVSLARPPHRDGPNIKRRCATGAGAASSASAAASRSSSSPRNCRTSWRADFGGGDRAAGVPEAAFFAGIAKIYQKWPYGGVAAVPKGSSIIVQAAWRQASLKPKHSNGMRTKLAQASGGPRRGLYEHTGRVSAPRAQNPDAEKRDLSVQIDSEAAAAHSLQKHTAAAMLPVRDFRRRRRRPFAALGQPLIGFWLAALLVQAAAQPHAREHHAQHIMNQARAHQKACGCSVSSQSRRARSAERHAVEQ